jgi:hypothetical protein
MTKRWNTLKLAAIAGFAGLALAYWNLPAGSGINHTAEVIGSLLLRAR